ncbi:hypothetical protein AAKU67_004350 [Oxalobacteraceae bacterium GrIS 2.11]
MTNGSTLDGINKFLRTIAIALGSLIYHIQHVYKDDPPQSRPIFIHGYDYPVPDGRSFNIGELPIVGPWLKPALDHSKVNTDLTFRTAVIKELIDQLNTLLQSFASADNSVVYIDSRGTLNSGAGYQNDWANELHPTPSGFSKIVSQCWMPALKKWKRAR